MANQSEYENVRHHGIALALPYCSKRVHNLATLSPLSHGYSTLNGPVTVNKKASSEAVTQIIP